MPLIKPLEPTSYGADTAGLVWGFVFPEGGAARTIDSAEALTLLAAGHDGPSSEFLWLHFSLGTAGAERWLRTHTRLPEAFFDSLAQPAGATRLDRDEESLIAVVHDALFQFTFDPSSVSTVYLCVQPNLLVSARPRPLRSLERLRTAVRNGTEFRSPASLLAHLMRDQADVLVEIVREATSRTDAVEDRLLERRITSSRLELGTMRRTLIRLQRLLAPEPAALFRLLNHPPEWLTEADADDLRSAAEEFSAAVGDSGALMERVKLLQEELGALVNEQTNRTLFLLTLVTMLALPVNVAAGLFGMNVGGIPFGNAGYGFGIVVAVLAITTCVAGFLVWRIRRD